MKHSIINHFVFLILFLLLISCGKSESSVENEFLGKLPSLEKEFNQKIDEKEKEIKECTDMEDSFKLSKELQLLKDEKETVINDYLNANPLNKSLPFETLSETPYTIKDVVINKASSGNLNIKFLVTINEDMKNKYGGFEKNLFIYYKAQDSKGMDIPKTITVATNFRNEEMKAGLQYEVFGSWMNKSTKNMEDFAKVVEITRDDYNLNK